jgi:hypothetical protein
MAWAIVMSTAAHSGLNSAEVDRRRKFVPTVVVFLVGLGFVLAFNWGAPAPEFRPDALGIILSFVFTAAVIAIVGYLWQHRSFLRFRFCTSCGRRIPFDARLCPYCGHNFPP